MPRSSPYKHRKRHRIGDAAGWLCHYCGRELRCVKCFPETTKGFVATLDHVVPKAKGGTSVQENLVLSCQTCNNKKADNLVSLTYRIANVRHAVSMPTEEQWEEVETA